MSGPQARQDEIAKCYGYVLFNLAQEKNDFESVAKDISSLEALLKKDRKAWQYLISPMTSYRVQKEVVEKISVSLKIGRLMHHFLLVLCQNRRLRNLAAIFDVYRWNLKASEGVVEGVLESATELSATEIKTFEKTLEAKLGHRLSLHQVVKKSLIAGIVVKVGSYMIDASLKSQLNQLQQAMKG